MSDLAMNKLAVQDPTYCIVIFLVNLVERVVIKHAYLLLIIVLNIIFFSSAFRILAKSFYS